MKENKKRLKCGVVIDYSIRIPEFKETFLKIKEQVLVGMAAGQHLEQADLLSENSFWTKAVKEDSKVSDFYATIPIPESNISDDFDITFKKYFYNNEHRLKFLEEWSYGIFGQGAVTNKADVTLINTAQSKLCDIVLIDRCTNARKVPNTFAFLSRSGLFIKEVVFVNTEEEINEIKEGLIACWDPYTNKEQIIKPGAKFGQPTQSFMDWFMSTEKLINPIVK